MSESGDAAQRGVTFKSPDEPSRSLVIAIVANSRGLTLEQWVSEYAACLPDTVQEGSIAGTAAIYCTSRPEELPEDAVAFQQRETMVLLRSILPQAEFQLVIDSLRS
jgi:hypothetical protein